MVILSTIECHFEQWSEHHITPYLDNSISSAVLILQVILKPPCVKVIKSANILQVPAWWQPARSEAHREWPPVDAVHFRTLRKQPKVLWQDGHLGAHQLALAEHFAPTTGGEAKVPTGWETHMQTLNWRTKDASWIHATLILGVPKLKSPCQIMVGMRSRCILLIAGMYHWDRNAHYVFASQILRSQFFIQTFANVTASLCRPAHLLIVHHPCRE